MLEFKTKALEAEFQHLNPKLINAALELHEACRDKGLPGLLVTDCIRNKLSQGNVYTKRWLAIFVHLMSGKSAPEDMAQEAAWLLRHLPQGRWHTLLARLLVGNRGTQEMQSAMSKFDDLKATLEPIAASKATWHFCACALDIRTTGGATPRYTEEESDWLAAEARRGKDLSDWEIINHKTDGPPHLHIAVRDFAWREKYLKEGRELHA